MVMVGYALLDKRSKRKMKTRRTYVSRAIELVKVHLGLIYFFTYLDYPISPLLVVHLLVLIHN